MPKNPSTKTDYPYRNTDPYLRRPLPKTQKKQDDPILKNLPIGSSDILDKLFGLNAKIDLDMLARDVIEMQPPQTQGKNTLGLAKYIISIGEISPYYEDAQSFETDYKSNTCYICGYEIAKGARIEELEHLLPVGQALSFGIIDQRRFTDAKKEYDSIYNLPQAKGYLLEYRRSHRCCNQIKGIISPLTFTGQTYIINESGISNILEKIWDSANLHSTSTDKVYQELVGCKEPNLQAQITSKSINKEDFVKERINILTENYFTPLLNLVLEKINSYADNNKVGAMRFAQLIMLSNLAMTIDQIVWTKLNVSKWTGEKVSKDQLLNKLMQQGSSLLYKNTFQPILLKINSIYDQNYQNELISLPPPGKQIQNKIIKYSADNSVTGRRVDFSSSLSPILNTHFEIIQDKILNYLKTRYQIGFDTEKNYCVFGLFYMQCLLYSQNPDFKFTEDMYPELNKMMINVNNFCILSVYMYIIWFNPLNSTFPLIENLTKLIEFNNSINIGMFTEYFQKHENFTLNVFGDFIYTKTLDETNNIVLDIKDLNLFITFLLSGLALTEIAETMLTLSQLPSQTSQKSQLPQPPQKSQLPPPPPSQKIKGGKNKIYNNYPLKITNKCRVKNNITQKNNKKYNKTKTIIKKYNKTKTIIKK